MYWDSNFLLPSIRAPLLGSDHASLPNESRSNKVVVNKLFCFEKSWLSQPDFAPLVEKCGNTLAPFLNLKMSSNYIPMRYLLWTLVWFDTKTDMHLTDEFFKNLDFLPLMRTLFYEKSFLKKKRKHQ
jgi:hypothetical protein